MDSSIEEEYPILCWWHTHSVPVAHITRVAYGGVCALGKSVLLMEQPEESCSVEYRWKYTCGSMPISEMEVFVALPLEKYF
eukprot:4360013-Ditylum_brightwellii.AAC.1